MGLETIAIISAVAAAVGSGVSYYGQQQAAKSQEQFATLNAGAALQQATMQSRLAMANAQMEQQQASLEQAAQQVNAQALRGEADARTRAATVNASREREAQREWQAQLRARQAAGNVVDTTGSPMALLEKAAEDQHLAIAEGMYQNELQRRSLLHEAANTDRGAAFAGIQGNLRYLDGLNQASAYRAQGYQAQINSLGEIATARAGAMASTGQLLGSVAGQAKQGYDFYRQGAFRFGGQQPMV